MGEDGCRRQIQIIGDLELLVRLRQLQAKDWADRDDDGALQS